jgi:serine/threonine-protein phosphatase 5
MNAPYGFESECRAKLNVEAFRNFSKLFNYLPVGHIINKSVLVVHGGLFSDQNVTIETIQRMPRFSQPPDRGPMNDILWSDPMDRPGFAPSPRGVTIQFGPDVTDRFLRENGLKLLIRSHQVQHMGYCVQHSGKCITVFSAPNYLGRMRNKGAIVVLTFGDGNAPLVEYKQFTAQPIPASFRPMMYATPAVLGFISRSD